MTADCTVQVFPSLNLIDPAIRKNVFLNQIRDFRYAEIVEDTLNEQFVQKYFLIRNKDTGGTAIQPFFFVDQDALAGLPTRIRNLLSSIRRFRSGFLKFRIMMLGCAAGEGQLDSQAPWAIAALHEAAAQYAKAEKASLILLKDFPSEYRDALRMFSENGYARVPSMPGAQMAIDFSSFDEYMQEKLSRMFRKNLRRKFKDAAKHPPITMEVVNDATPFVDEIHPLYLQTFNRSEFRFEKLTPEYLCAMGRLMPERTRYFLWRQEGRIIAFALCMVHGDTICDMNVGMDYSVALDLHLYFLTFRDILQWSAENGMKSYLTGPLNYDPKLHLRLDLCPLDLYVRHTLGWINPFLKIALKYLQPARHDKAIRQFRNAHELY